MLSLNAGLRALALLLCCLAGASGYGTVHDSLFDASVTKTTYQAQGAPALPGQAQTAGPANDVNLLSRLWRPGQGRLSAYNFSSGDGADYAADIAVNAATIHDRQAGATSQGYAPGTHISVPSFYHIPGSPRSPPLTS
jgi:hypothetical protein